MTTMPDDPAHPAETRWPALLAIVTAGLLYAALPHYLAFGPRWLLVLLVSVIEFPAIISHYRGYRLVNKTLGFLASATITAFLLWSVALLVTSLPAHKEQPIDLLKSAATLWISNILVFALWYWRLDAGGPLDRDIRPSHTEGAFLFPQMTWDPTKDTWSPRFMDYLFLSFNTSTALSPTDVPILSRWAKALVMLQALISMTTIVLLAARAVNIL
jgi:hypothetical protein